MTETPASPSQAAAPPDARVEWAYLHLGFVLIGISMTMLGPVLPYFTHRWNLTDEQAGLFFSTQYFGSFLGTLATSWLLPRLGFSKVISAGYLCFALGLACLGLGPWYFSTVFVAIYGTGYGLATPSINLRATHLPSSNVAAAVSLVNFSWGIGAVSSPFLVAFFLDHLSLRALAALLAACFLALALAHFVQKADPVASPETRPKRSFAVWRATLLPAPWISLVLLFFLYVGIEISVGGWVALDEKRMVGFNAAKMAAAPAFFYGFLLLGRFLVPIVLRYFSQRALSVGGLVLTTVGVGLVAFAQTPMVLHAGALLAGLGCGPQYPIYVTWLAAIFEGDATWLAALFFGAAGIGSSLIPWLVGVVASQTHSLRFGFMLPLVSALLMIPFALRVCPNGGSDAS
ncbi:MAG TPA: MFS transporter [Candidatus Acidoferrum sp.]|jgi:fucose permease|nr:MFS transporter [Candidatus Acidoferrum sp.]